jgi:BirA family biotin operon repressor/biotin-[acetyl-CoA-carboxylase] ligase
LLVKKLLTNYYKKNITLKKPNDLLIQKKKISGILQEKISIMNNKFLIVGIGMNIKKSPKIKNYLTTSLNEITNKAINKREIENRLKLIFETSLSKMYKMNKKLN